VKGFLKFSKKEVRDSFLQSILAAKKGLPRPNKEQLRKEKQKFLHTITTPLPPLVPYSVISGMKWADINEYPDSIETEINESTIEQQCRRTVRELYKGTKYTMADRMKLFFFSTSANYIKSRNGLGAVGAVMEDKEVRGYLDEVRKDGGYLKIQQKAKPDGEETNSDQWADFDVTMDSTQLEEEFKGLWFRILRRAIESENLAEPVALAEALKIRLITKGNPFKQIIMRNLWKKIHTHLRKHPAFSLIGAPVTEAYMLERLGFSLGEDEWYLSGDYKAATDNLRSFVSNCIADEICNTMEGISSVEREMFIDLLTRHKFEVDNEIKRQERGQLMGSIMSFPVLCIANAALCRWAVELTEKRNYTLRDCKLMVNGDDCAFRTKKSVYEIWQKLGTAFGLEESLGKTFLSREFVNINSTNFTRVEKSFPVQVKDKADPAKTATRYTHLKLTKYVNLGLLYGIKRSGEAIGLNDQADQRSNVSARARELLRLAPDNMHQVVMKLFIRHHKSVLEKTRLPWYIPEWLGGLGLPTVIAGPSELDLRQAHKILLNWNNKRPLPLSHPEVNWKTWQLAAERLPPPVYTTRKGTWTDDYSQVVAVKCVDLLFDKNIELADLYKLVKEGEYASRAIARNAKLWTIEAGKLPTPLHASQLDFLNMYPNYVSTLISSPSSLIKHTGGSFTLD